MREAVAPGVSTADLDAIAERGDPRRPARSRRSRATTATRPRSAPRSTSRSCTPSRAPSQVLRDGDLISIDCGAVLDGWHGDAAITVGVGEVDPALLQMADGRRGRDVGRHRRRRPGRRQRQGPADRHLARGRDRGPQGRAGTASSTGTAATASAPRCTRTRTCSTTAGRARARGWCPGMALAIEPMITMGSPRTVELADGWTVVTRDGSVAAHVEHTMALLRRRRLGAHRARRRPGPAGRPGDRPPARRPIDPLTGRSRRSRRPCPSRARRRGAERRDHGRPTCRRWRRLARRWHACRHGRARRDASRGLGPGGGGRPAAGRPRRGPAGSARVRRAAAAGLRRQDVRRPGRAADRPAAGGAGGSARRWRRSTAADAPARCRLGRPPAGRRRRWLAEVWLRTCR